MPGAVFERIRTVKGHFANLQLLSENCQKFPSESEEIEQFLLSMTDNSDVEANLYSFCCSKSMIILNQNVLVYIEFSAESSHCTM